MRTILGLLLLACAPASALHASSLRVTPQRTGARSSAVTMMPIGVPKVHQCTRHRPPAARAVIDFVVLRAGALPISRCLQCRLGARSCHARTPARPFVPVSDTPHARRWTSTTGCTASASSSLGSKSPTTSQTKSSASCCTSIRKCATLTRLHACLAALHAAPHPEACP